jgi:pimeloyl-ACP methyl ester carboxylesterase
MPQFDSSGVSINYIDEGSGPPVVLVHGFASDLHGNWRAPGIVDALVQSSRRVIALDCRGHGRSGKPHEPEAYANNAMETDVIALMDHLGIDVADLAGYSMGGFISSGLIVNHPERFRSAILAGVGDTLLNTNSGVWRERSAAIADALTSKEGGQHENVTARGFRIFAERSGNDLEALAAMQRVTRHSYDRARLSDVRIPVMVLIGEGDTLVGNGEKLTAAIAGAKLVRVPGDHLTAVGAPALKQAIVGFFDEHSPVSAKGAAS